MLCLSGLNDLIVLCFSIPMTLSSALLNHWRFGPFLCKLVHFTPTLTALVSTFTVAVIAVERWFFIVNKQKFDRRCTIVILILIWIVSIIIASPDFISRELRDMFETKFPGLNTSTFDSHIPAGHSASYHWLFLEKKILHCAMNGTRFTKIFSYVVATVQYLVPFLFVSVSCYSISRYLKRRMKRMRAYQRPTKTPAKILHMKLSNPTEVTTEQDLTSVDDTSIRSMDQVGKSKTFFDRFRRTFQPGQQAAFRTSFKGDDQQHFLKTQSHTERRFHRSRKLLICVAALFTISWLPLTIAQLYIEQRSNKDESVAHEWLHIYLIPCYLISSLSAAFNPVIYNYINRSFRREFYALYPCCCPVPPVDPRREWTSMRSHRPGAGESPKNKEIDLNLSMCVLAKTNAPAVSFAEETRAMIHGESDS